MEMPRIFKSFRYEIEKTIQRYKVDTPIAVFIPATTIFIEALQEEVDPYTLWQYMTENNITIDRTHFGGENPCFKITFFERNEDEKSCIR